MFNVNTLKNRNTSLFKKTNIKELHKLPSMLPPRDTPKQHSNFLHNAALLLYFFYHLPRGQNQVPDTTLNSLSSQIPTINHSSRPTDSTQVSSRSITSDALIGVVDPLAPHNKHQLPPPPPFLHIPSDSTSPAQTLARSLSSEPLHTFSFTLKSFTVGGGRVLTIGTLFGWDVL